ncbi:PREDICTED: uncharacterized protein C15orf65 homolog isoform X1 [Gavialis gangeticus]|uniref:uncharacterized protein C15orf65 homolog isoform X1 n=2 Tax=Gavialis gangeticus TaxID=94835 RepID=UPI00092F8F1B|nr:PREDICTED: uncharacterized protein C15orf65 homolog isoform X1 [Gavialis gangeticus]
MEEEDGPQSGGCPEEKEQLRSRANRNPEEKKMTSAEKLSSSSETEKAKAASLPPCANPGNPVFSCMLDPKALTTNNFLTKPQLLLFKTTSSDYGAIPPTSQMVPCKYHAKVQTFSKQLLTCGLRQHNYINTAIDKSRVYDYPNLQHTL